MIRLTICLASCLVVALWWTGLAAEGLFDTSKPIVEIEWRGQANMGQDEFLERIGIQMGDTLHRDAIHRSLERLYLKDFFSQIRIDMPPIRDGLKPTYDTTPAVFIQGYGVHHCAQAGGDDRFSARCPA
jgi:outer membrane protein assembly factor BamA